MRGKPFNELQEHVKYLVNSSNKTKKYNELLDTMDSVDFHDSFSDDDTFVRISCEDPGFNVKLLNLDSLE